MPAVLLLAGTYTGCFVHLTCALPPHPNRVGPGTSSVTLRMPPSIRGLPRTELLSERQLSPAAVLGAHSGRVPIVIVVGRCTSGAPATTSSSTTAGAGAGVGAFITVCVAQCVLFAAEKQSQLRHTLRMPISVAAHWKWGRGPLHCGWQPRCTADSLCCSPVLANAA